MHSSFEVRSSCQHGFVEALEGRRLLSSVSKATGSSAQVSTKIAPVVFVIGGFGDPQYPEPGVGSVQQDYEPMFQHDGISRASQFRYYEQNYDTDTLINRDHDSIAAEIDRVPAGTPVVVIGFSFGGGQAIRSCEQADRKINDLLLFDPVVQTNFANQVINTRSGPQEIVQTLPGNVLSAVDCSRDIFQSNDKIYPEGPYGFRITGRPGTYENLIFPHSTEHWELLTPFAGVSAPGAPGSAINDTSALVKNALAGLPMF
jgi:hypothetical protein